MKPTLMCLPILATLTLTQGVVVPMIIVRPAEVLDDEPEKPELYSETNHMMTVEASTDEDIHINLMISLHRRSSWAVHTYQGISRLRYWLSTMLPKHTPFIAAYSVSLPSEHVESADDNQMEEFFGVGICVVSNFVKRTLMLAGGQLSAEIMFGAGYDKHGIREGLYPQKFAKEVSPPGVLGLMSPHKQSSKDEQFNFIKHSDPKIESFAFWVDPNDETKGVMATNEDANRCGRVKRHFKVTLDKKSHPTEQRPGILWAVRVQQTEATIEGQALTPVKVANSLFKFSASRSGIYLNKRLWKEIGPLFADADIKMLDDMHFVTECAKLKEKLAKLPTFRFHLKSPDDVKHTFEITPHDYTLKLRQQNQPDLVPRCVIYIASTGDPDYSIFGHVFMKKFPTQFKFDPKETGKKHEVAIAQAVGTCG